MSYIKRLNLPLWILAMCLFWVLTLYANGDADREFLKNSRAEFKRLDEISQQKNNIDDPKGTINSGLDLSYVPPSRGGNSVSAITQKSEEEESAEEEEKNWLLYGMEKLSGIKLLTEDEKKRLLEPGSGLHLIDRYVLAEEMAGIKTEGQGNEENTNDSDSISDFNSLNPLNNLSDLSILNLYHPDNTQNILMLTSPLGDFNPSASLFEGEISYKKPVVTLYNETDHLQQLGNSPLNSGIGSSSEVINPYLNNQEITVTTTFNLPKADKNPNPVNSIFKTRSFNNSDNILIKPVEINTAKDRTYQPAEDNLKKYLPQLDSF